MKYMVLLLAILYLGGCSMFHTTPEGIVQGAEMSAKMAAINAKNVRSVNDEYCRVFSEIMKKLIDDEETLNSLLNDIQQLHDLIGERFYRPADLSKEISAALAEYLKTPGIGVDKVLELISLISEVNHTE